MITYKNTPLIKESVSYDDELRKASIENVVTLCSQEKTILDNFLNLELEEFVDFTGKNRCSEAPY